MNTPSHDPSKSSNTGDRNVEQLISQAYHPPKPDEAFSTQLTQRMIEAARRRVTTSVSTATTPRSTRSWRGWLSSAAAGVVIGLVLGQLATHLITPANMSDARTLSGERARPTFPIDANPLRNQTPQIQLASHPQPVGLTARPLDDAPTAPTVNVGDTIVTHATQKRRVMLPDDSVLYINADTTINIASARLIELMQGEVFVEATPISDDEHHNQPFVVRTPDRTITALGTKFAVRHDNQDASVVVTQGKVIAQENQSNSDSTAFEIRAGQQLLTSNQPQQASQPAVVPAPRADHALAWARDLMLAAHSPLVPKSEHAGGALVCIDPFGQQAKLSLRKYHVDVFVQDGFARTTIDQTYFNHENRRLEGTFYFPLPPDASLSRLAMYVNGKRMEGGMAEREHARTVYESIVYRRQDPALLEWVDGSTFKMRVFPLEARQEKRIIISYTQKLGAQYGRQSYHFPAGHNLDRVNQWSFHAQVKNGEQMGWNCPSHPLQSILQDGDLLLNVEANDVVLDKDIVLNLNTQHQLVQSEAPNKPMFTSATHEQAGYLMFSHQPSLPGGRSHHRRDWVFVFESSAARNPVLARAQIEIIRTMLEHAEHTDTFNIVAAGTRSRVFSPQALAIEPEHVKQAIAFLDSAHLVGAMDLGQALTTAQSLFPARKPKAGSHPSVKQTLVHIGSGIPTLGERRSDKLVAQLRRDIEYIGVGVGKNWSRSLMKQAAGRTGGYFTQINPDQDVHWRTYELIGAVHAPRLLNIKLIDADERAVFLTDVDTLIQGESVEAFCRVEAGQTLPTSVILTGELNGQPYRQVFEVNVSDPSADYLPRIWARREIDRLLAENAEGNKPKIIELSKAMYVMSPYTSLLVLEDEKMYEQFKVDRGRKDHWALYPAPDKIDVVFEPNPLHPIAPGAGADNADDSTEDNPDAQIQRALNSILVRIPPTMFSRPNSPYQDHGGYTLTAYQLLAGVRPSSPQYQWGMRSRGRQSDWQWFDGREGREGRFGFMDGFSRGIDEANFFGDRLSMLDGRWATDGKRWPREEEASQSQKIPFDVYLPIFNQMNNGKGERFFLGTEAPMGSFFARPSIRTAEYGEWRGSVGWNDNLMFDFDGDSAFISNGRFPGGGSGGRNVRLISRLRRSADSLGDGIANHWAQPRFNFQHGLSSSWEFINGPVIYFDGLQDSSLPVDFLPSISLRVTDGEAMEMGLKQRRKSLIHHTLRASQRGYGFGRLQYQQPQYRNDARVFTDLLAYAPGMNTSYADILAVLEKEAPSPKSTKTGRIDQAARQLIDRARNAGWRTLTYLDKDGGEILHITFDGLGKHRYERTLTNGLREVVVSDGETLWRLYPQLGVGAKRPLSRFHQAEFRQLIPALTPSADEMARGFDVIALDEHTVGVSLIGADLAKDEDGRPIAYTQMQLVFDQDGRLSERRIVRLDPGAEDNKKQRVVLWRDVFAADGSITRFDGQGEELARIEAQLVDASAPDLTVRDDQLVILELPYRTREHVLASRKLKDQHDSRQYLEQDALALLAAELARGDNGYVFNLIAHRFHLGDRRLGYYTLLLTSQRHFDPQVVQGLGNDVNVRMDPRLDHPNHALTPYLVRMLQYNQDAWRNEYLLASPIDDAFLGSLAQLRLVTAQWVHGQANNDQQTRRAAQQLSLSFIRNCSNPYFAWAAAAVVRNYSSSDQTFNQQLAEALKHLKATPGIMYELRYERARALYHAGDREAAVAVFDKLYNEVIEAGGIPAIDYDFRNAFRQTREGAERLHKLLRGAAEKLEQTYGPAALITLAWQCRDIGEQPLDEVFFSQAMAQTTPENRFNLSMLGVSYLWGADQPARAQEIIETLLENETYAAYPELWRLLAEIAAQQGKLARSLGAHEQAMELAYKEADGVVNLQAVRQEYSQLLSRYEQLANAVATLEQQAPESLLMRVIAAADRWRDMDDQDEQACQYAARILRLLGERELAWDYLTTPLATHSNEAAPWSNLAAQLHQQGDLALADRAYAVAFDVEPTNAQVLWDRAQLLQQAGRFDKARQQYQRIADQDWQPRFERLKQQAIDYLGGRSR